MKSSLLFFAIIAACTPMFAGNGTLSVSPAVVMLHGTPGQSTTQTLTIVNQASQPFSFQMQAQDVVIRKGKRVFVPAGQVPGSIAATAVFSQNSITVPPGAKVSVEVTMTIPVAPTVRAVIALFHGTTKIKQQRTEMTASLGTLLTFTLSDGQNADAGALAVRVPTTTSNLAISQQLSNNGSEPLFAKGMLAIVNSAGSLIARESMPTRRLLPGEVTAMSAEYGGDLPAGHYRALVSYDLQNDKPLTSSAEFDVR